MNSALRFHMKNNANSIGYAEKRRFGPLAAIRVKPAAGNPRRGWLTAGPLTIPVALGRGGILANKREGDGGTPRGSYRPRQLWWRGDRHSRPQTFLPARIITGADAWCEDPGDRHYNQWIRRGSEQGGDRLKRADHLYDFIIEIDHNRRPRQRGIFASGARQFRTDRRLRLHDEICDGAIAATLGDANQNHHRVRTH